ncbi:peptidase domain-containing ABC transporter [Thalassotalea litorea]|uniref:Peptidase domain-containing ABC transporter n=1 Tax=Thalassotalea litorea TaxID=2020715 RepID=A0A5R9IPK1_9GAMM|nr:peptidase domain-containing ABC transporter [Thalassotalea litorea]TLU67474.1 peptidase domain-containing ABC transporter [Thalassotalea litorea]
MTAAVLNFSFARKVPMILQTEIAECGLACIAMIASYFGHSLDMAAIRQRHSAGSSGMTLQQMIGLSEQLNLSCRALQCPLNDIRKLKLPCILHWDMNHFVVLTRVTQSGKKTLFYINDPGKGNCRLTLKEFEQHFTGICLELTPTANFVQKQEKSRLRFYQLWSKSAGVLPSMVKLILLSFLLQFCALLAPYYMQWVVDEVLVSFDQSLLMILGLGFALVVFLTCILNITRSWIILRLSSALNLQMGVNLMAHLLRLPMSFFEARHIGDLVSRFGSLAQIRERITTGFVTTLVDGILSLALLVMMFAYSVKLTFIVISVVALYSLIRFSLYRPLKRISEELIQSSAKEQSHFLETARGMQTVKLFAHESIRQDAWQNKYVDVINHEIRLGRLNIGFDTCNKLLFGLENVLVIFIAAGMVMSTTLTVGMLLAFIAYKNQFTARAMELIEQLIQFKMMRLHLDRIADIALHEEERNRQGERHLSAPKGELKLVNVSFSYQQSGKAVEPLLKNINLTVAAGESIAITGPSGVGKSTLMKIMLGLLQPTSGSVLHDGQDITQIGLLNYRRLIAGVLQDDTLLSGSIADNICFFDPNPNLLRIEQCARAASIHNEIAKMTMGYNSVIADMGTSLSGGQMQRILLARALYKQPVILFMDEATSHLDCTNEKLISEQFSLLKMTRVTIAHRQETLDWAETLYEINDGTLYRHSNVQTKITGNS